MENKQITILKNRISELEKSHNRLTAIVVYMFRSRQLSSRQKSRMNNEPNMQPHNMQPHNMQPHNMQQSNLSNDINSLLVDNDDSNIELIKY